MKKWIAVLSLLSISLTLAASAFAASPSPSKKEIVKVLATEQVKNDVRTVIGIDKEGACGGEGPSYVVNLQIRKMVKTLDPKTGLPEVSSEWVTVKTYSIGASEVESSTSGLMDAEACIE